MKDINKIYELITKELTSEISDTEQVVLDNEMLDNPNASRKFSAIKVFWNNYFPKSKPNNIIEKTEKKLGFKYGFILKTRKSFLLKIAALIIFVLSFSFSTYQLLKPKQKLTLNEYSCAQGEIKAIVLSDGTKVWLNSSSILIASEPFTDETREVMLFGEAYFEVAHNAEQPFIVKSPGLETKVLGTIFNITAYPEDEKHEISLYEGKVELKIKYNHSVKKILIPGQRAYFNTDNNELKIINTDLGKPAQWRDGILRFYDEDMNSIAKKLERKFQTKILISDKKVGNLNFTANFDIEPLEKILDLLKEAQNFNYQKTENGIILNSM